MAGITFEFGHRQIFRKTEFWDEANEISLPGSDQIREVMIIVAGVINQVQ